MDAAEAGRVASPTPTPVLSPSAQAHARARADSPLTVPPAVPLPGAHPGLAQVWARSSACYVGCGRRLSGAAERLLGPSLARRLGCLSPRRLAEALLFLVLLAVCALSSMASILSKPRVVHRPLFYLSTRLLFPVVGYATVRYGQLGACLHVAVAAASMLVTDFFVDGEQAQYGQASAAAAGALFEVLVCPILVVILAWCVLSVGGWMDGWEEGHRRLVASINF